MITIYRTSERIPLKIGELEFVISPLDFKQRKDVQAVVTNDEGSIVTDTIKAAELCIKYQIKEVKGLVNMDGSSYKLEFDNDVLTDNCVNDIMGLEIKEKLAQLFFKTMAQMKDPEIKGVEITLPGSKRKNVKRRV